ncbi:MAG: hypothetical protein M1541_03480 [Acidobacteria bacterium]|nr:hypothetical protein [Acidobacteriota bacterium]
MRISANRPLKMPVHHGPIVDGRTTIWPDTSRWPWWKRFCLSFIRLDFKYADPPARRYTGRRLWVYTRTKAYDFDFVFERRIR